MESKELAVPLGSLVCVTGSNGMVGSHIVDQVLAFGYRVRGIVRNLQKSDWMLEHFNTKYGANALKVVQVPDLAIEGSLDSALQDCVALIHAASDLSFSPDPNTVNPSSINQLLCTLHSALKHPTLTRFIFTSSSLAAASQTQPPDPYSLTPTSWNTLDLAAAWAPPSYTLPPDRFTKVYAASKVQAEQAFWEWMDRTRPHFVGNAVLPDWVTGAPVHGAQGFPSGVALMRGLWYGDSGFRAVGPGHGVDAGDVGRLHVAAMARGDCASERVFAYGWSRRWTEGIEMWQEMYPDHEFPEPPPNEGYDMSAGRVTARPRAEELLEWISGKTFRPMEESLKELGDYIEKDYKANTES
ncbi:NAD-dependent epimerase/dehydratase terH [Fulvia fulva]|uniref:NAD-dependent epimerase/dehydratase terH n=1 Tax=Passalora fulva TaxID=5499 RepID=A0A9Q8P592_PASFU|nr:NAD-dependent epimerase/dehydratase terH [Fulvia fulva]KAK4632291.1 NAD-dependent epimerase/dehydratase terH [Fulvia fulva]KAK4632491.1 NAD-dependent epimerase/dehydratase terH [Fulvia fulva]UJO13768.1 NAD-dependent epimerase/dehydratase terH [Fulvia fulva]WPV11358.1 NAD-dependent epimerase/dehydratase terH [Fulvia fulva]WPV25425.1 NAD-dependent epimerase/dehydratase terH [Fulvia fulva]